MGAERRPLRRGTRAGVGLLALFLLLGLTRAASQGEGAGGAAPPRAPRAIPPEPDRHAALGPRARRFDRLPLRFEANQGQTAPEVKFLARGSGYTVFLTAREAVLSIKASRRPNAESQNSKTQDPTSAPAPGPGSESLFTPNFSIENPQSKIERRPVPRLRTRNPEPGAPTFLRLKLLGANFLPQVTGLEELPGKSAYFIGNDPKQWRASVPNYAKVRYRNVYPGVDLVYYGNPRQLEYDFVVAPGADPRAITLKFETGNSQFETRPAEIQNPKPKIDASLRIDAQGDLVVPTEEGEVRFHKPIVYQMQLSVVSGQLSVATDHGLRTTNTKHFLDGHYVLRASKPHHRKSKFGNRQFLVGFDIASYDHTRPLIIDPVLSYSTYLGGSDFDYASGIAVDSLGNAYVTGYTNSLNFPKMRAFQPTIGGGACGPGPGTFTCFNVFVTKMNPEGSALVYSTYLGGSREDFGAKIAVDSTGSAYVTGYTNSANFPTVGAVQAAYGGGSCGTPAHPIPCFDAFVAKLRADGSALVYSSYLGGAADDYGFGIAVDSTGSAYVAGFSSSRNFPTTAGAFLTRSGGGTYDAFIAKINAAGSALVYSTYLGGSRDDFARAIAVDASGSAYVAGYTNSSNFPTANAYQATYGGGTCGVAPNTIPCSDAFVTKLNPTGSALVYSTYLGGSGGDYAYGLALDASGNAYVTGYTVSADFPITTGAGHPTGSTYDVFAAKLNTAGSSLVYSTHLGAPQSEVAYGIAVNSAGNVYVTGYAYGTGFPTVNPLQSHNAGFLDAFVAKLNADATALTFSTYLGGRGDEEAYDIAVDSSGNAYVAGSTFSTDFPTTPGAFQRAYGGGSFDAFVAKIGGLTFPAATLSAQNLAFADQGVDTTGAAQALTLANRGDGTLSVASIRVTGDFAQTNSCGSAPEVTPGNRCTLNVTFTPTALGPRAGAITITDNAQGSPRVVGLSGKGVPAPRVALSTTSLAFPARPVGTASAAQTVTVTNTGGAPLNIARIAAGGDFAQTNTCGAPVAVGAGCTVGVTFTPAAIGPSLSTLGITDNAPGSPHVLTLSGTGVAAYSLAAGVSSVTVIRGMDRAAFTLTASSPSGLGGTISLACSGNGPAQCTFDPASISVGQTSTLTVTNLTAVTSDSLNFTVTGTRGSETASISLGIAISDFLLSVSPSSATIAAGQTATYTLTLNPRNGFNRQVSLTCGGLPQAASCVISPLSVSLNGTGASSATLTLTTTARSMEMPGVKGRRISPRITLRVGLWALLTFSLAMLSGIGRKEAVRCRGGHARALWGAGHAGAAEWLAPAEARNSVSIALPATILLAVLAAAATAACGGGGGSGGSGGAGGGANSGTPPGTYTFTITGTLMDQPTPPGGLSRNATATVTVN